ncbi:alpha/beta-hydrolase [Colletotrichum eremochloae]|nr:alpha/beta-hydrolase [Colletotrichum eremochloae]
MTFGGSDGQPRHLVNVSDEHRDFKNMIAWVKKQDTFDSTRDVAWGTSFGGMHVTRLLSEDHTITAGIAQCPCVDAFLASRLRPFLDTVRLGLLGMWYWIRSVVFQEPIYVQAAATPGSTGPALMNAPDVVDGWKLLHRDLEGETVDPYSNRIAARSALGFPLHRPALKAGSIIVPYLIVVPSFDSVAPKAAAEEVAKIAANGELCTVPGGHFDLYSGGVGYPSNLQAQLEFLKRHIHVSS